MNPAFLEYTDGYLREEEIEDEKGNIFSCAGDLL